MLSQHPIRGQACSVRIHGRVSPQDRRITGSVRLKATSNVCKCSIWSHIGFRSQYVSKARTIARWLKSCYRALQKQQSAGQRANMYFYLTYQTGTGSNTWTHVVHWRIKPTCSYTPDSLMHMMSMRMLRLVEAHLKRDVNHLHKLKPRQSDVRY